MDPSTDQNLSLPTGLPSLATLPLTQLTGVGKRSAEKLAQLGIKSVQDLLLYLPFRYENRSSLCVLGQLSLGERVRVLGTIDQNRIVFGRRRMLLCRLVDASGTLGLRFFNFSTTQRERLAVGTRWHCFGEVRAGSRGLEMIHPELEVEGPSTAPSTLAPSEKSKFAEDDGFLTPVYPVTEGLHQLRVRGLISQALNILARLGLPELIPESVRKAHGLMPIDEAIYAIHRRPKTDILSDEARPRRERTRLAFEELLAHQLSLRSLRTRVRSEPALPLPADVPWIDAWCRSLPFVLTGAQRRVYREITQDLSQAAPMMRLLQGDVGSGKTLVAILAALHAVAAGVQAALMAPTELLVEQHANTLARFLGPLGLRIVSLSGRNTGKARRTRLTEIASGAAQIIVGTHALFQVDIIYANLGLVIVDEQHRFGVPQRLALLEKGLAHGRYPHQLIMTATPIPRTLAMTAYADLDVSVIDELPPGRTPVKTVVIPTERRAEVMERVQVNCRAGQQAYWVCPLIEESEVLQCQAATSAATQLQADLRDVSVGLIHGRLKAAEKTAIMQQFARGTIQLLVATTVIEVGVDVPNASLMVVENAERLGLAQLHQLRGRIGRGSVRSSCVLLFQEPLGKIACERLRIMRASNDGFEIAQKDLELRGPGEVLGVRQTGAVNFRIADLSRDAALLDPVKQTAEILQAQHPEAAQAIIQRWLANLPHYTTV